MDFSDKATQVAALLEDKKFSAVTRNLFAVLAANGRLGDSSKVTFEFPFR
jgi:F0F1-type ATP synthase delta subunit